MNSYYRDINLFRIKYKFQQKKIFNDIYKIEKDLKDRTTFKR